MIQRLIELLHSHSIRVRILISQITIILISLIIVMIVGFSYIRNMVIGGYEQNVNQQLDPCVQGINRELYLYIKKSMVLPINNFIVSGMKGALTGNMASIIDFDSSMRSLTAELESSNTQVTAFSFYMDGYIVENDAYIISLDRLDKNSTLKKAFDSSVDQIVWSPNIIRDKANNNYLVFYRNVSQTFNKKGLLQVCIPNSIMKKYINNIELDDKAWVVVHRNSEGKVIYLNSHSDNSKVSDKNINKNNYMLIKSKHLIDGSEITIGIPKSHIIKQYFTITAIMISIFAIFAFIAIKASNSASSRITKGLMEFINYIKNNEDQILNDNELDLQIIEDDEVAVIKQKFIKVLRRMNEAYKSLVRSENQNNMLQMDLLQARINPHLLYNSLTVIKIFAIRQNDEKTSQIVDSMTNYYRVALNNGEDLIELNKEISMVTEYLNIIKFTYMHEYKLNIVVKESIMGKSILMHLLQPIIENSVLHALNGYREDGKITIRGYEKGEYTIFEVSDNGCGMDIETIEKLLDCSYKAKRGGYGIKNLIKRIKLYYGEDCGLEIHSELEKGTCVTVKIKTESEESL